MKTKKLYLLKSLFLIALLSMILSIQAFAANNALRYKIDFPGKYITEKSSNARWASCTFDISAYNTSSVKLSRTVEVSGDIIIPAKLFMSKKSTLEIRSLFSVNETTAPDYEWIGSYQPVRDFSLNGKGQTGVFNFLTEKAENPKKRLSVTKKSNYYVIHFVDTFDTKKADFDLAEGKVLDKNKKVNLGVSVSLTGSGIKAGYVYADNLKIKTDKKTITMNFNKKDYRGYGLFLAASEEFILNPKNAKVVKSPV